MYLILSCRLLIKLGAVDLRNGAGTGNTALAYHAGRLLALNEGDLPYAVRQPYDSGAVTCRTAITCCMVASAVTGIAVLRCWCMEFSCVWSLLQIRVLCNGLTETLGRLRFSRSWKTNFTAHPKIDPVNGGAGRRGKQDGEGWQSKIALSVAIGQSCKAHRDMFARCCPVWD